MEMKSSESNNEGGLFNDPSLVSISTKSGGSVNESSVTSSLLHNGNISTSEFRKDC